MCLIHIECATFNQGQQQYSKSQKLFSRAGKGTETGVISVEMASIQDRLKNRRTFQLRKQMTDCSL